MSSTKAVLQAFKSEDIQPQCVWSTAEQAVKMSINVKPYIEAMGTEQLEDVSKLYGKFLGFPQGMDMWKEVLGLFRQHLKGMKGSETILADVNECSLATFTMVDTFHELVKNAIDAFVKDAKKSGSGSVVALRIKLESDGTHVILTIDDNGPGFPEALRQKYNCSFVKGGQSDKSENQHDFGGKGMALARIFALIREGAQHGGGSTHQIFDKTSLGETEAVLLKVAERGARVRITTPIARPADYESEARVDIAPGGGVFGGGMTQADFLARLAQKRKKCLTRAPSSYDSVVSSVYSTAREETEPEINAEGSDTEYVVDGSIESPRA